MRRCFDTEVRATESPIRDSPPRPRDFTPFGFSAAGDDRCLAEASRHFAGLAPARARRDVQPCGVRGNDSPGPRRHDASSAQLRFRRTRIARRTAPTELRIAQKARVPAVMRGEGAFPRVCVLLTSVSMPPRLIVLVFIQRADAVTSDLANESGKLYGVKDRRGSGPLPPRNRGLRFVAGDSTAARLVRHSRRPSLWFADLLLAQRGTH